MADIADVYIVRIYFKGTSGIYKPRPVVIINSDKAKDIYTIAEITSVKPDASSYYDQFNEEIIDWKSCGLDKKSYVKCKNIHNVNSQRLLRKIGEMDEDDFLNIAEKIVEYNG